MAKEPIYLRLNIEPGDPLYDRYKALQHYLGLKNHAEVIRYLIRSKRIPSQRPEISPEMQREAKTLLKELKAVYPTAREPLLEQLLESIAGGEPAQ